MTNGQQDHQEQQSHRKSLKPAKHEVGKLDATNDQISIVNSVSWASRELFNYPNRVSSLK
jgi:hypothetical protein